MTPAGIVRGNDPFLYGENVKAYLRKGARPLRGGRRKYIITGVAGGAVCQRQSAGVIN